MGAYALSEAGFRVGCLFTDYTRYRDRASRPKNVDHQRRRSGDLSVFCYVDPTAGYKGITCFVAERGAPGFAVGKKEDKLGIRASSTCELILDGVPAQVLGERGKGYKIAIETLNEGRIGIAAQMLALPRARWFTRSPRPRAQAIRQTHRRLSRCAIRAGGYGYEVEAARLMVYNAARLRDARQPFVMQAAMAKYFCSTIAEESLQKRWRSSAASGSRRLSGRKTVPRRENRPNL